MRLTMRGRRNLSMISLPMGLKVMELDRFDLA